VVPVPPTLLAAKAAVAAVAHQVRLFQQVGKRVRVRVRLLLVCMPRQLLLPPLLLQVLLRASHRPPVCRVQCLPPRLLPPQLVLVLVQSPPPLLGHSGPSAVTCPAVPAWAAWEELSRRSARPRVWLSWPGVRRARAVGAGAGVAGPGPLQPSEGGNPLSEGLSQV
jgi:hypothetical protein